MLRRLQYRRWQLDVTAGLILLVSSMPGMVQAAGFIKTPDSCFQPERIENGVVVMKKIGPCLGQPGRAFVDTDLAAVKIDIGDGASREAAVESLDMDDVSGFIGRAKGLEKSITIPTNKHEAEMTKMAEQTNSIYQSPEYQAKLEMETERLKKEVLNKSFESYYPDALERKSGPKTKGTKLAKDERVYLFISSSMPMQTIRNYVNSVVELGDPNISIVMRGFVGGASKVGPTVKFIAAAIKDDALCDESKQKCTVKKANINIDPLLFRKYGVSKVPAVVYAKGLTLADAGLSEGKDGNATVRDYSIIYGDASLEYLLDQIAREDGSPSLKALLAQK